MCSRHDDPSQIDVAEIFAEEESAMKWRYNVVPVATEMENILSMAAQYNPRGVYILVDEVSEKFAEAVRGANEMRKNAFWKMLRDLPKYSDEYIILHSSGTAANKEIEFGIPTFKQNFFGLNS